LYSKCGFWTSRSEALWIPTAAPKASSLIWLKDYLLLPPVLLQPSWREPPFTPPKLAQITEPWGRLCRPQAWTLWLLWVLDNEYLDTKPDWVILITRTSRCGFGKLKPNQSLHSRGIQDANFDRNILVSETKLTAGYNLASS
jgi:hypothetical protein